MTTSSTSTSPTLHPPWSLTSERVGVIGFWSFLAALEFLRLAVDPFRQGTSVGLMAYVGIAENVIWAGVTLGLFWLMQRLPLDRDAGLRRVLLYVALGLASAITVEMINFWTIRTLFLRGDMPPPFNQLPPAVFRPIAVILRLWFLDEFVIYLGILGVAFARNNLIRLREREQEAARFQAEAASLQAQLSDARLSALRMQLNPHFLFNTLHTISALADDDAEGVQRIVARLSGLLRRTLEGTARQEVPLAEELSFLRDYLEIQRVRFQGNLEVVEAIDADVQDALVPNLILQPLVENAVKHGSGRTAAGVATIVLGARHAAESDHLVLSVQDNGPGLAADAEEEALRTGRVGIANTRERLHALYGPEAGLDLTNASGGGLIATITLPYHTADDLRTAAHT